MSNEVIVLHPETGVPALEVKSYVELDREQLEQEVKENEVELEDLVASKLAEFEATLNEDPEVKAARSAVEDSKSKLAVYDELAPQQSDTTGDGASSSVESDEEAGDGSTDGSSEPSEDSEDGDGTVAVPVSVTHIEVSDDDEDEY
jgi:hypothetical protein